MVNTRTNAELSAAATAPVDAENWISHMKKIFDVMSCEDAFKTRLVVAAAGTAEEQAKNFQWGLRRSTLNHLMCMPFILLGSSGQLLAPRRSRRRTFSGAS
nr:zinc finger, CCHC-type, retrotransposon Gag domain protein [Tanacetum cinerariifolium]